jgi:hypothetical protein
MTTPPNVPVVRLGEVFWSSLMLFIDPSVAFRNLCRADKSTLHDPEKASNWNRRDSKADSNDSRAKTGDQTVIRFCVLVLSTLESRNWLQVSTSLL